MKRSSDGLEAKVKGEQSPRNRSPTGSDASSHDALSPEDGLLRKRSKSGSDSDDEEEKFPRQIQDAVANVLQG